jgi:hypothetical protein
MAKRPRHGFPVIPSEDVAADAVEVIEEVLARAKAGELSSVSIAWTTREGVAGNTWSAGPHSAAQIGSAAIMLHQLAASRE